MPTKAQAMKTRADAEKDMIKEGARCVILYDPRLVDPATGRKSDGGSRSVRLSALRGSYKSSLVDGMRIQQGDMMFTVADKSLAPLRPDAITALVALDGSAASGYWLYLAADPERYAVPSDPPAAGDRRLSIVRLQDTVHEGGYPILRILQCRG